MDLHDQLAHDLDRHDPLGPDVARLTTTARTRGRRLARRRRALVAGGTLAVLAVGGVVISALPGGDDPSRGGTPSVAADPTRPTSQTPVPAPGPREATAPATARGAVAALISALGEVSDATTSGYHGQDPLPELGSPDYYALVQLDDGGGLADVGVNVQFDGSSPGGCVGVVGRCRAERLPGGGRLASYEIAGDKGAGDVRRVVELVRADGVRVVIGTSNGVNPQGAPAEVTRPEPPLTYAQLRAVVVHAYWDVDLPVSFLEAGEQLEPFDDAPALVDATPIGDPTGDGRGPGHVTHR